MEYHAHTVLSFILFLSLIYASTLTFSFFFLRCNVQTVTIEVVSKFRRIKCVIKKTINITINVYFFSQDLLITLSTLLRGSVYERLRWTFKLYDVNGDGCISRGELSEVVVAVHELMGRRAHQVEDDRKAREQIDKVFRKLDLNQDGVITIEEFMESCLKDDVITRSLQMFDAVL